MVDGERSVTWEDLGADSQLSFRQECQDGWEDASAGLESREVQQALDTCLLIVEDADTLSCEEWRALYL